LRVSYTISSKLSDISFSVDVPELSLSAILNIVEMSSWKKNRSEAVEDERKDETCCKRC
jgi:hypothetical protein